MNFQWTQWANQWPSRAIAIGGGFQFVSGEAQRSLIVVPCSKASANQRAGRAGRVRHQAEKCPQVLPRWSSEKLDFHPKNGYLINNTRKNGDFHRQRMGFSSTISTSQWLSVIPWSTQTPYEWGHRVFRFKTKSLFFRSVYHKLCLEVGDCIVCMISSWFHSYSWKEHVGGGFVGCCHSGSWESFVLP